VQVLNEVELFKSEPVDVFPMTNLLYVQMDVIKNAAWAQTELLHFLGLVNKLR